MNDAPAHLVHAVRRAGRRLAFQRAFRNAVLAGNVVMAALAATAPAALIMPLAPVSAPVAAAVSLLAVALLTTGLMLVRPVDLLTAARVLDLRAGLEERTSTALEVSASGTPSLLGRRVLDDAATRVEQADLPRALPWRIPRAAWVIPACTVLLLLWPLAFRGVAIPGTPAHRTQQAIRQEGQRLEEFARLLQSRTRAQRTPQTRRVAPQVRDLGLRLQRERVDRAEALARIADLSRRVEEARREIDARLNAQRRPAGDAGAPQDLFRRQALQQQIRQLRELTTRLQQNPERATSDALQRLGEMTQSGEGDQPAEVRAQLQRAREQLQQGNAARAGQSLTEALRELEGLEGMLADEEGLRSARRQLERSQAAIASGGASRPGDTAREGTPPEGTPSGPGEQPVNPEPGAEAIPPEGPHEGSAAGRGRVTEKMGAPSERLGGERRPDRVPGAQSEGPVSSAEVLGAGRPGTARRTGEQVSPTIVAQADRAMERARTPGRYRALVRRYFERLSRLR